MKNTLFDQVAGFYLRPCGIAGEPQFKHQGPWKQNPVSGKRKAGSEVNSEIWVALIGAIGGTAVVIGGPTAVAFFWMHRFMVKSIAKEVNEKFALVKTELDECTESLSECKQHREECEGKVSELEVQVAKLETGFYGWNPGTTGA